MIVPRTSLLKDAWLMICLSDNKTVNGTWEEITKLLPYVCGREQVDEATV